MAIPREAKSTNKKKITKIATGGRHPGAGTTQMPPGYSKKGSSLSDFNTFIHKSMQSKLKQLFKGKPMPPELKQFLGAKPLKKKIVNKLKPIKPLKTSQASPRKRYRGPEPRIR